MTPVLNSLKEMMVNKCIASKKNFVVRKPTNDKPSSKQQTRPDSRTSAEKASKRQKSDTMDSPTRNVQERTRQDAEALKMQEIESKSRE